MIWFPFFLCVSDENMKFLERNYDVIIKAFQF
jgi:hypothetical protein